MFPTRFHPRAVLSAAILTVALLGTACSDSTAPSKPESSADGSPKALLPTGPTAIPGDTAAAQPDTTAISGDTTRTSAGLKPAMSVAGTVVCYVGYSNPARAYSYTGSPRVQATGWINYCTGPVIQANVTVWLYQYYSGAWHIVAGKTATRYGVVTSRLKVAASVACTGSLTGYWFATVGMVYATSTSGLSTSFPFSSAPKWVTC